MKRYKLIEIIKNVSEYVDPLKEQKSILTDFINENFLKYNQNELELLHLIYRFFNPILKKYGLILIFKGGNVMRLINNNLKEYLYPIPNEIILDIFEPYLKQSDNDFTIFINPNIEQYDTIIKNISYITYEILADIRSELILSPGKYFNIFKLNNTQIDKLFRDLNKKLNSNSVRLHRTFDKKIILKNELDSKSDIMVYDDLFHKQSYIFNSINTSLEFTDPKGKIIKFYLLRSKINFIVNNTQNIAGELIDISLPHKNDAEMQQLNSSEKFEKYMRDNIIEQHNSEYNFDYYMINIHYIIKDLIRILYKQFEFPWSNEKYTKRVARMIYFIFIDFLNEYSFSIENLEKIKYDYNKFITQLISLNEKLLNDNGYLQKVFIETLELAFKLKNSEKNKDNFTNYLLNLTNYSYSITRICNKLIDYLKGKIKISEKNLYELDIV
jgi:hypothetical protein